MAVFHIQVSVPDAVAFTVSQAFNKQGLLEEIADQMVDFLDGVIAHGDIVAEVVYDPTYDPNSSVFRNGNR